MLISVRNLQLIWLMQRAMCVKILVKGNSNLMYRDAISLDTVFYMNNELVKKDLSDN